MIIKLNDTRIYASRTSGNLLKSNLSRILDAAPFELVAGRGINSVPSVEAIDYRRLEEAIVLCLSVTENSGSEAASSIATS